MPNGLLAEARECRTQVAALPGKLDLDVEDEPVVVASVPRWLRRLVVSRSAGTSLAGGSRSEWRSRPARRWPCAMTRCCG